MSRFLFNGPATFDGAHGAILSLVRSTLFCGILSTVVFGVIGYRRAVGKERFRQAVRNAPRTVAILFRQDGDAARVHLFWGAAVIIAMQLVSPWLGAAVAVGFLSTVPSVLGRMMSGMISRAWSSVVQAFAPPRQCRSKARWAWLSVWSAAPPRCSREP